MRVRQFMTLNKISKFEGLKVRTPKLVVGYIFSVANNVIYLCPSMDNKADKGRLFPQVVNSKEDVYEWEVVKADIPCNCAELTQHRYIMLV